MLKPSGVESAKQSPRGSSSLSFFEQGADRVPGAGQDDKTKGQEDRRKVGKDNAQPAPIH